MKKLSIPLLCLFVSALSLLFFIPVPSLLKEESFSTIIFDEQGYLLRLTLNKDDKYRVYTPLKAISPLLIEATLLQEDQYFFWHYGINPLALSKAFWHTYILKSRRVGASTITMQVARLRFGLNSKTLKGKFLQIVRALQIEMHYSKKQILEAYLNLAPYGGNIEGIGAASLIYFNTNARAINLPQALILSVIPQNPNKRSQDKALKLDSAVFYCNPEPFGLRRSDSSVSKPLHQDFETMLSRLLSPNGSCGNSKNCGIELKTIRNALFARWVVKHPQDNALKATLDLPLIMRSTHQLPFIAPHFVTDLVQNKLVKQRQLNTTLNIYMQTLVEKITRQYLSRKKTFGVNNAAVLLVDTRDMSIKAALGSANFKDTPISGQINGTDIKRSPGSTLKPFIYALALDQGLIHPHTVLKDVPQSFGSYNPENFDYDFMGPIKAKDALILSRNIPAIYLANQLKHPNLFELLELAQVSLLKPASFYGLALSLGGGELTMKELTSLYAMLANAGIWHPLRSIKEEPLNAGQRLLSPEASYLILDILQETPHEQYHNDDFKIAFKTGTSSGFRDAWTVGIFGPYVLSVWVGNFNNKSNPAFVGKNIAAPLFFELIEAISREQKIVDKPQDLHTLNIIKTEVCKASGLLPTTYCLDKEMTWFIPGKSPIKTDTIYREVAINADTGLRTCHINDHTRFAVYEFWSSDLLKIFKQAGIHKRLPPNYEEDCSLLAKNTLKPQITSLQNQLHYIIKAKETKKTVIPFSAVTDGDVKTIYWFINEAFIAKTAADTPFLWSAKPGKFVVRVVDDHGLSDVRKLMVEMR